MITLNNRKRLILRIFPAIYNLLSYLIYFLHHSILFYFIYTERQRIFAAFQAATKVIDNDFFNFGPSDMLRQAPRNDENFPPVEDHIAFS